MGAIALLALLLAPALAGAWPTDCIPACPAKPKDLCDFYFNGYPNTVPSFAITGTMLNLNKDLALTSTSNNIMFFPGGSSPAVKVTCGGSGNNQVLGPNSNPALSNCTGKDQFYVTNSGNQNLAMLFMRTFQVTPGVNAFKGKCYKLPLRGPQVFTTSGNIANPQPSLNVSRTCVVFKIAS